MQLLPSIRDLPNARRHQYAAFIMEESSLVVWDDDPMNVCRRAADILKKLTDTVWAESEKRKAIGEEKKEAAPEIVEVDPESGEVPFQQRKTQLLNTTYVSLTLILIISVLGAGARELAIEVAVDGKYIRLAFLALTPIQVFFTLVSCHTVLQLHHNPTDINIKASSLHKSS